MYKYNFFVSCCACIILKDIFNSMEQLYCMVVFPVLCLVKIYNLFLTTLYNLSTKLSCTLFVMSFIEVGFNFIRLKQFQYSMYLCYKRLTFARTPNLVTPLTVLLHNIHINTYTQSSLTTQSETLHTNHNIITFITHFNNKLRNLILSIVIISASHLVNILCCILFSPVTNAEAQVHTAPRARALPSAILKPVSCDGFLFNSVQKINYILNFYLIVATWTLMCVYLFHLTVSNTCRHWTSYVLLHRNYTGLLCVAMILFLQWLMTGMVY